MNTNLGPSSPVNVVVFFYTIPPQRRDRLIIAEILRNENVFREPVSQLLSVSPHIFPRSPTLPPLDTVIPRSQRPRIAQLFGHRLQQIPTESLELLRDSLRLYTSRLFDGVGRGGSEPCLNPPQQIPAHQQHEHRGQEKTVDGGFMADWDHLQSEDPSLYTVW